MKRIGITGGIGSGKTTVCEIFKSMGIQVYDADNKAKKLMNHNRALKAQIKSILGVAAYHRNGRLNRAYVANKIFADKKLLTKINKAVHPAVNQDAVIWFKSIEKSPYALYEAALLVENGSYASFDKLIVVTAPEELRIARVMKRDKTSKVAVQSRMKNQLPEKAKVKVADYIIVNDGNESLIEQVVYVHRELVG